MGGLVLGTGDNKSNDTLKVMFFSYIVHSGGGNINNYDH